ncbi:MAG: MFS transporter [Chloroflexi bacterium]|nr:MFS transporter [Chloroflexota bacterium]
MPDQVPKAHTAIAVKPVKTPKGIGKVFYGWWIVLAGALLNAYTNAFVYYGFTAYFNPIVQEFGWSRAATSFAFSIKRMEEGVAAPVVGFLFDRVGARRLMIAGAIIGGLGLILMGRTQTLAFFYVAVLVVSLGMSFAGYLICSGTISHWFVRKRGLALSLLSAGAGIGGLLIPIVVWLTIVVGWRTTLLIGGIGLWVIGIPAGLIMKHKPEEHGCLPDGASFESSAGAASQSSSDVAHDVIELTKRPTIEGASLREALRTRSFWLLSMAYFCIASAMSAVFIHIIPALTDSGFSRQAAGFIAATLPIVSIIGRLSAGWLADRFDKRYVLAGAAAFISLGTLIFAYAHSPWQIALFVLLFNIGQGATVPTRPTIQGEYFGLKSFGAIYGILYIGHTMGSAIGPVFAGRLFDLYHSYTWAFVGLGLVAALGVPLALMAKRPAPSGTGIG